MKILMVSTYPPMKCGIGTYAFQAVQKYRSEGNIVDTLTPHEGKGDFVEDLCGSFKILKLLKYVFFYNKVIIQYHASFFYRNGLERLLTHCSFIIVMLLFRKFEVIAHEINYPLNKDTIRLRDYLENLLERIKWAVTPKIIFHTNTELQDFKKFFKINPGKNKVSIYPPHYFFYKFRDISQFDARQELGLIPGKIFLCIGFIQPHKGFDRAIKAFNKYHSTNMHLYVVGSLRLAYKETIDYLSNLKFLAAQSSQVHIIEQFVSDELFDTWISASDVVIVPYREIWSSGVMGRAKLFDKPVIAAKVGGLKEQAEGNDLFFSNDKQLEYIFECFGKF
ncbi:glycosyltransferase [Candidatus Formimonas warabiya]|uniref:Glycosyltransferase family 4 protein n=1 Tax=Formimonas warabiya TaxID=1761012 RepID=A0A3G1KZ43_FORW1|nr:glycosyltransferase [Candidatus Formimonas warabiya]ATW27731.1 hypothetical protein DCMF_25910 [Candidatus Formimonas warabiya]